MPIHSGANDVIFREPPESLAEENTETVESTARKRKEDVGPEDAMCTEDTPLITDRQATVNIGEV